MIKLTSILHEVQYKREALNFIQDCFNECIDTFYSEYKEYIQNGKFIYPLFDVKTMSNLAGYCELTQYKNLTAPKIKITIHSDFSNVGDTTKSIVFHETIHYIQYNLKLLKLDPYSKGLPRDDGHDTFFHSEMNRINGVMGPDFVKRVEDKSAYLSGTRERFIYVVKYSDENLKYIQRLYNGVKYGVAIALRHDKSKLANFVNQYGTNGNEVYMFKSRIIGWGDVTQIGSGISYLKALVGNPKIDEIDNAISSGEAELVDVGTVTQDYLYVYCVYNKKTKQPVAVYSNKNVPIIQQQVKDKFSVFGKSNYLFFEFKTTNPVVADLQKFIKGKSFKYVSRTNVSKFLINVMNKEEPGIIDYNEVELEDM